jgi:cysteinyl-tRNA synthetase
MGVVLYQDKEFEKALKYFKKTLDLKPGYYEPYAKIGATYDKLGEYNKAIEYLNKALDFIRDNLNTAGAIATISELLKDNEISKANQYKTLLEIDKLLGLKFEVKIKENKAQNNLNSDQSTIPAEILKKAEERQNMRKSGDYEGADRLRDEINVGGYEVVDKGDDFEVLRK